MAFENVKKTFDDFISKGYSHEEALAFTVVTIAKLFSELMAEIAMFDQSTRSEAEKIYAVNSMQLVVHLCVLYVGKKGKKE